LGANGQPQEGNKVRLKYGYVVQCTGVEKDASGQILRVLAELVPDTKSGTPGTDSVKVKGVVGWVGHGDAEAAEFRLYERLFETEQPGAAENVKDELHPDSLRVVQGYVEPGAAGAQPDAPLQFERLGYFVADARAREAGQLVFNRASGLRDSWAKYASA